MLRTLSVVLGILLIFGCADVSKESQLQTGCSGGSESTPENEYVSPSPSGPDTTPPTITSTSPSSGATSVSVSGDITITFSESMDSSTINTSNITLADSSGNAVNGVISYSSNVATFNPSSDLIYNTTYTMTVGTGVKDSAGNPLGMNSNRNFTTEGWSGTKQLGTTSMDLGQDITSDSSGNIYVTGGTEGGLDGNTSAGSRDIFLIKYNNSGTKQWTKQLGTSGSDEAQGITSDSSGNVYLTGYTSGALDGNTSAGSIDLFIVKYNSSGVKQ